MSLCPRCNQDHNEPVTLELETTRQGFSIEGRTIFTTKHKVDGFRCLVCFEEWIPSNKPDVPAHARKISIPPSSEWCSIFHSVITSNDNCTIDYITHRTDLLWIALRVRQFKHNLINPPEVM